MMRLMEVEGEITFFSVVHVTQRWHLLYVYYKYKLDHKMAAVVSEWRSGKTEETERWVNPWKGLGRLLSVS